jgi:hypothetical protein
MSRVYPWIALIVNVETLNVTACNRLYEVSEIVGERVTRIPCTFRVGDFIVVPCSNYRKPPNKVSERQLKSLLARVANST